MPSGQPAPQKRTRQGRATDDQRVEMVREGDLVGIRDFELSLISRNA